VRNTRAYVRLIIFLSTASAPEGPGANKHSPNYIFSGELLSLIHQCIFVGVRSGVAPLFSGLYIDQFFCNISHLTRFSERCNREIERSFNNQSGEAYAR
jgi:hypothetical protein